MDSFRVDLFFSLMKGNQEIFLNEILSAMCFLNGSGMADSLYLLDTTRK